MELECKHGITIKECKWCMKICKHSELRYKCETCEEERRYRSGKCIHDIKKSSCARCNFIIIDEEYLPLKKRPCFF
jgi:hypothetical protein